MFRAEDASAIHEERARIRNSNEFDPAVLPLDLLLVLVCADNDRFAVRIAEQRTCDLLLVREARDRFDGIVAHALRVRASVIDLLLVTSQLNQLLQAFRLSACRTEKDECHWTILQQPG